MSNYSFPKASRLLSVSDFNYLKSNSKIFKSRYIKVFYKDGRLGSSATRIGTSVSKKVGNAVCRNLIKRICREYFRKSDFKNLSLDLLLVVSPKLVAECSRNNISERFEKELDFVFSGVKRHYSSERKCVN